jgi:hypothetical protein
VGGSRGRAAVDGRVTPQDELDLPPPPPPPERAYQCSSRHLYDHRLSGRGDANSTSLPPSASAAISSSLSAPPSSVADDATAGVGASSSVPSRAWRLTHSDDEAEAPAVPVRGADDGMHLILNRKLPSNGRLSKTSTTCTPCSMHASTRLTRTRVLHANMHATVAGCERTPRPVGLWARQPLPDLAPGRPPSWKPAHTWCAQWPDEAPQTSLVASATSARCGSGGTAPL